MDLAFWEISIVYFFVMQMKACDFYLINGSRQNGRTSQLNADCKIKIEGFQTFTQVLTLSGKYQHCRKQNVDCVTNELHEGQTIRMSLAAHLPVPSHVCDYNDCSVPCF